MKENYLREEIWRCPTKEEKEIALIRSQIKFLEPPKQPIYITEAPNQQHPIEVVGGPEDSSLWLALTQIRRASMYIQ